MKPRWVELFEGLGSNLRFSNRLQLIYDRLFRRHLPLTHYIWKNRIFFICNTSLGDHIAVQECFCLREYDALLNACQFASNRLAYVNIGANIGAFDLLLLDLGFALEYGLAVELNPLTCARCTVNLQANHVFSTRIINAGAAGTDGSVPFNPSRLSLGDSIFTPRQTGTPDGFKVEMLTLATLLERHGGAREQYDLLKMDCEQAEYEIIRLTPAAVLQKFRHIIVEFHPEPAGESVDAAYAKLQAAGFHAARGRHGSLPFVDVFIRA
jgi:FkbM family methyltransferase